MPQSRQVISIMCRGRRSCWIDAGAAQRAGLPSDNSSLQRFIDNLMNGQAELIDTLKDDWRSHVALSHLDNDRWVVKKYLGPPWKTLWYHLVRRTPAWREWRYARQLRDAGFRVIDLVALIHDRHWGAWSQVLVAPYIDAPTLKEWIRRSPPQTEQSQHDRSVRHTIARTVGQQVGMISAAGLVNRDHKVNNILIDKACESGAKPPLIIDPARVKRRWSQRTVYRTLALLSRTADQAGPVTLKEKMIGLRAVLAADPSLARGARQRLRYAAAKINRFIREQEFSVAKRKQRGKHVAAKGRTVAGNR